MKIAVVTVRLYAPWVHSLKEKRMEIKSLLGKICSRFNVSAAETDEQDTHQILVISVAAIAADSTQADSILDHVLNFIETNTDAEILDCIREFR